MPLSKGEVELGALDPEDVDAASRRHLLGEKRKKRRPLSRPEESRLSPDKSAAQSSPQEEKGV